MGDNGADENKRGQGQRNFFLASDGIQNLVGAKVFRRFEKVIQADNHQTADRQQVQNPAVGDADGSGVFHRFVKQGAYTAAYQSGQCGQ